MIGMNSSSRPLRRSRYGLLAGCALILAACAGGPAKIETRHWEYNEAVRRTHDEQLLLNIVRLRYAEMPCFLQVTSISSQFSSQAGSGLSGSASEGAASIIGASGSLSVSESPVVTWSLPDSAAYLGRLLAPVSAAQLTVLSQAGWGEERLMRVGVKKLNRLRNAEFEADGTVYEPESYGDLREALRLISELRREDLLDLAYGVKSNAAGSPFPREQFDTSAIPDGLPLGIRFMSRDDPNVIEPLELFKPLFLRFSLRSDDDPRAQRLRELLDLDASRYSFGIVDTVQTDQMRSESGRLAMAFDLERDYQEIVLNNRSIMEIMRFISTLVEVPQEDLDRGWVKSAGGVDPDWLRIRSSSTEPVDAWLRAEYGDHWFYIARDDLKSRSTFTLLGALFASVVGTVPGGAPLLTLPVR